MARELEALTWALSQEPGGDAVADGVGCTAHGPVGILTLSAPGRHNVLSLAGWQRVAHAFRRFSADDTTRVVVVRGAGGTFGAGADIKEFPEVRLDPVGAARYNEAIARALRSIQSCRHPVVAMVRGLAVGGGLELAAACDLRLAATDARFGLPIAKLGVTLGVTETRALTRVIGPANLTHLVLSGRLFEAAEALRIGLVQEVHAPDEIEAATALLVHEVTTGSAATIRALKAVIEMVDRPLREADTEFLVRQTVEVYPGPDLSEGVRAFGDRRPARFPSAL
jgi:enoyl-CoA hydratase